MLTPEQIYTYHRDGVLTIPAFFDRHQVDRWQSCWQSFRSSLVEGSKQRIDRFIYGTLPGPIGDIYTDPNLISCIQQLLGPDLALYFNRILLKDHTWSGSVHCHQDMPYFTGGPKISAFVPIEPLTKESGGLSFIAGTHKYGLLGRGTIAAENFGESTILSPAAMPGDLILMDFYTWHFSEDSRTHAERPVLQLAYQPTTDGSYYGEPFGVSEPTCVCGEWKTDKFFSAADCFVTDIAMQTPNIDKLKR